MRIFSDIEKIINKNVRGNVCNAVRPTSRLPGRSAEQRKIGVAKIFALT